MPLPLFFRAVFTSTLLFCLACSAVELVPIRPERLHGAGSLNKRDTSALDLRNDDSFVWGYNDGSEAALANFTIYTPTNDQHILSMEKFAGMLKSAECKPDQMILQFIDDATFAYAQRVWDWVNGADNHTFIMVAGAGDCGANQTARVPYLVRKIKYDEKKNIATLNATESNFKSLAKSYNIKVGDINAGLPPAGDANNASDIARRDFSKDASFSLASKFPFLFKVEQGPLSGELECDGCETTGKMIFEMIVSQNVIGVPNGVSFSMRPSGVSATVGMKLTVGGKIDFKKSVEWKETVLSIPLSGFSIPGDILSIGPVLDIDVGGGIVGLEGTLSMSSKGVSRLSDSAMLKSDFLNPSKNEFHGWLPTVNFEPPKIEAKIAATAQAFLMPAVRFKATILEQGVETGLELKLPYFDVKFESLFKQEGGVCNKKDKTTGFQIQRYVGAELKFSAGTADGKVKPVDLIIASKGFELGEPICLVSVGPAPKDPKPKPGGTTVKPGTTLSTSTKTTPQKPATTASSAPITTCKANNGLHGTCISTKECKDAKGISEPGHCPGNKDIQCCYQSTGSGDSCKVDDGRKGICMSTSACSDAKSDSVPGFCPGPKNIQCCVPKKTPPPSGNKICTLKGTTISGECVSTDVCKNSKGTSTPGLCGGGKNIQCCTYGTCRVGMQEGYCQPVSSCKGSTHVGLCGGGASIQCCTP